MEEGKVGDREGGNRERRGGEKVEKWEEGEKVGDCARAERRGGQGR